MLFKVAAWSKMSIKKRAAAAVCAIALAVSLAGCGDTSYICKTKDYSINAGVYIYFVINQINSQAYSYYYANSAYSDDIINEAYGDGTMTVGEYAQDYAYQQCEQMLAIQAQFDALDLELTQEEKDAIGDAVDEAWNADYYESIGVSKESVEMIQTYSTMSDKVFDAYYLKDGIEGVSDEDVNAYLDENYIRFKVISIQKAADDSGAAAKKLAEEYKSMAEEMTFDEVIAAYKAAQSAGTGTGDDSSKTDESESSEVSSDESSEASSADDSSAADDTSVDDSSAADSSSQVASPSPASSDVDESSSETDSSSDDSSETETGADSAEDEDKYANDAVVNKNNEAYADNKVVKFIDAEMKYDEIATFEDDSYWYVIQKLDLDKYENYETDNYETLVSEMKSEDFQTKVDTWITAAKIDKNEKSVTRYTAKRIYKDYEDYQKKQSNG